MIEDGFMERLRREPLPGLRALRKSLREEERQVSYWRRLVQGRLDLARTALAGDEPNASGIAPARPAGSGPTSGALPPSRCSRTGAPAAGW